MFSSLLVLPYGRILYIDSNICKSDKKILRKVFMVFVRLILKFVWTNKELRIVIIGRVRLLRGRSACYQAKNLTLIPRPRIMGGESGVPQIIL